MEKLLNEKVLILAILNVTVRYNIMKGDGENNHLRDLLLKFFTGFSRLFNATYIKHIQTRRNF